MLALSSADGGMTVGLWKLVTWGSSASMIPAPGLPFSGQRGGTAWSKGKLSRVYLHCSSAKLTSKPHAWRLRLVGYHHHYCCSDSQRHHHRSRCGCHYYHYRVERSPNPAQGEHIKFEYNCLCPRFGPAWYRLFVYVNEIKVHSRLGVWKLGHRTA